MINIVELPITPTSYEDNNIGRCGSDNARDLAPGMNGTWYGIIPTSYKPVRSRGGKSAFSRLLWFYSYVFIFSCLLFPPARGRRGKGTARAIRPGSWGVSTPFFGVGWRGGGCHNGSKASSCAASVRARRNERANAAQSL